ncbi:hypothetical protein [Sphingomonas abietis]|uniref:Uncharacterized protein n=1 Tax=Sphingomonas abietis TaxID=3012344 RepID=A0ABY7NWK8_9SPHN|nr:hypothetical protein [Sphingomonas abietis]WBO23796.1 hypothetical protein PBT88_06645 [Sphingomonas abietis]
MAAGWMMAVAMPAGDADSVWTANAGRHAMPGRPGASRRDHEAPDANAA